MGGVNSASLLPEVLYELLIMAAFTNQHTGEGFRITPRKLLRPGPKNHPVFDVKGKVFELMSESVPQGI